MTEEEEVEKDEGAGMVKGEELRKGCERGVEKSGVWEGGKGEE